MFCCVGSLSSQNCTYFETQFTHSNKQQAEIERLKKEVNAASKPRIADTYEARKYASPSSRLSIASTSGNEDEHETVKTRVQSPNTMTQPSPDPKDRQLNVTPADNRTGMPQIDSFPSSLLSYQYQTW
jgi:hypothetical protein